MSRNTQADNGSSISKTTFDDLDSSLAFGNNTARDSRNYGAVSPPEHVRILGEENQRDDSQANRSDSDNEGIDQHHKHNGRSRDLLPQLDVQATPPENITQRDAEKNKPVAWRSLPRKDQLFVITLARLSEPLTQSSLGSYLYYQLQSFDTSLPDSTISYQAGIIQAAFPFAQFLTAMLWGRFADSERGGRKMAIVIGLLGTLCSVIGFGFSHSFAMAVAFRCLGGALNGNIGVMRTMISEIIKEKKYQSRAFLMLPMTFNIGVIIGPIFGGILADPVGSYPAVFGPGSFLGGKNGVQWMTRWRYALPNLVCATFLVFSVLMAILFLEETSELRKDKPDHGLRIGRWVRSRIFPQSATTEAGYTAIARDEEDSHSFELLSTLASARPDDASSFHNSSKLPRLILPFRRIFTRNLIITLFAHAILAMHVGGFNSLWFIYLSTPRYNPSHPHPPGFKPHGLAHFTGGLALPPARIGVALAILGIIGITLQLFIYPNLAHRLGTASSYRIFLALFPFTYAFAPFLSRVPSWAKPPDAVSGPWIWLGIVGVLAIQVLARTFALPCTAILINNVSPHPSVLGTVHGIGQSMSSLARTLGPVVFSWVFGKGLDMGIVGLSWWLMAGIAIIGWAIAQGVREGDGHEILMDGEVRREDGVVVRVS